MIIQSIVKAKIGNNSIMDILTLHPFYTPTILIEINENLTDKRIIEIAKIFSKIL